MYVPNYARPNPVQHSEAKIHSNFIQKYPFGTLISFSDSTKGDSAGSFLNANHYPFLIEPNPPLLLLHIARNNPQWKELQKNPKCLAIFQGPHGYISPAFYKNPLNVPTWNYTAVHAECTAEIQEDAAQIEALLERSVLYFEAQNQTHWKYDLPKEFKQKLFKAIVGVKLTVNRWEAKFKLSQNRETADILALIDALKNRPEMTPLKNLLIETHLG